MDLADVRIGQRVRWTAEGVSRTGQVFMVDYRRAVATVIYFSSFHRDWVRRELRPEQLEAVNEEQ